MSLSHRVYKTSFPTQWIVSSKPGTPVSYYTRPEDGSSNTVPTAVEPHSASQGVFLEARQHPLNDHDQRDGSATPPPPQSHLLATSNNGSEIASYASSSKDSNLTSSAKRNKLKTLLSFGKQMPAGPVVDKATPKSLNSTNSLWGSTPKIFRFRRQDKAGRITEMLQKNSSESTASQEYDPVLGSTQRTVNQRTDIATNPSAPPTDNDPDFEPPRVPLRSPSGTASTFDQSDASARFPYTSSLYTPVTPGIAAQRR